MCAVDTSVLLWNPKSQNCVNILEFCNTIFVHKVPKVLQNLLKEYIGLCVDSFFFQIFYMNFDRIS